MAELKDSYTNIQHLQVRGGLCGSFWENAWFLLSLRKLPARVSKQQLIQSSCFSFLAAPDLAVNWVFSKFSWPAMLECHILCPVLCPTPCWLLKTTFFINISNILTSFCLFSHNYGKIDHTLGSGPSTSSFLLAQISVPASGNWHKNASFVTVISKSIYVLWLSYGCFTVK